MPMRDKEYWNEGMDGKRFALCIKNRIWMILAAALAGALFSGALYLIVRQTGKGETQYRAEVLYSIGYDIDEDDETLRKFINEYNAYTWGDMMKSDKIILPVMAVLPDTDREAVEASISTEIASDPEFLTAYFTTGDPELSNRIAAAYNGSMAAFGETMRGRGLIGIEAWKTVPACEVKEENRVVYACELGALIGLLGSIIFLAGWYVLDDSILLESDIRKRYGIPVVGYRTRKPDPDWEAPLCANLEYMAKREAFLEISAEAATVEHADYEVMREASVILLVEWGSRRLRTLGHVLSTLACQDVKVRGVIIMDADNGFLRSYYGKEKKV